MSSVPANNMVASPCGEMLSKAAQMYTNQYTLKVEVTESRVQTVMYNGLKLGFLPLDRTLKNHLFCGMPINEAMMNVFVRTNPFLGGLKVLTGNVLWSTLTFSAKPVIQKALQESTEISAEVCESLSYGLASIFSQGVTHPIEVTRAMKEQNQKMADEVKKQGYGRIFRGLPSGMLRSALYFGAGREIGKVIQQNAQQVMGESKSAELAAMVAGLQVSAFLGSPLFNLEQDGVWKGFSPMQSLRYRGVIGVQEPVVQAESLFQRVMFGKVGKAIPRGFQTIAKSQNLWRGFLRASPITTSMALATSLTMQCAGDVAKTLNGGKEK